MTSGRERLLIAALPEPVLQGQRFIELPLHLRHMGWVDFEKRHQAELEQKFKRWFMHQPAIGPLLTDDPVEGMNARTIEGSFDTGPMYALHAFMKTFGHMRPSDESFADITPVFVAPEREVLQRNTPITLSHVALLSLRQVYSGESISQVEQVVALELEDDQETA